MKSLFLNNQSVKGRESLEEAENFKEELAVYTIPKKLTNNSIDLPVTEEFINHRMLKNLTSFMLNLRLPLTLQRNHIYF